MYGSASISTLTSSDASVNAPSSSIFLARSKQFVLKPTQFCDSLCSLAVCACTRIPPI
jgi:hypothetical protein